MTINYNFDDETFEFELRIEDKKACVSSLPKELLIDILSEYQEEMDPEELAEIKEDLANGREGSLRIWAFEKFDELEEFKEIAEEYFEDEAREQFNDEREYHRDTLDYYGLSAYDFI